MIGYPSETACIGAIVKQSVYRALCAEISYLFIMRWLRSHQRQGNTHRDTSRICCRCRRTRCLLMPSEKMRDGDRRASRLGQKKCYLVNLPAEIDLRRLAATVMAQWICEQAHLQLKEEFGLDHFEGPSWHGLHRHALMTMIAYAFLQYRRIAQTGRKKESMATTSAQPAGRASTIVALILRPSDPRYAYCRRQVSEKQRGERICQGRVSGHAKRLYDRAGNGRSASSTGWRRAICPRPRARRACAGRQ
jgi:hypothetical protein